MKQMKVQTALSRAELTSEAVDSVCREVSTAFGGRSVDLVFVFFSPHHTESADYLASTIEERLHPKVILGCSAESIIEGKQEIEN
jgi:small ligand-binding sensory domain FIST